MTIIYLVRHGQTDFIGKKLCGTIPGIHLNQEGSHQAELAADYLQELPIKAVYASPIERAMETAAAISSKLGLETNPCNYLKELNFGDLQGKMEVDLRKQPLWQQFLSQPGDVAFPNGESVAEAQTRVVEGLEDLAARYEKTDEIVCVAHSEIIRLAIAYAINLAINDMHRLTINPASISKLEWTQERKKLRMLNIQPN